MADEDKEKAEKVAAAKKRVGSPLKRLSGVLSNSSSAIGSSIPLAVVELEVAAMCGANANSAACSTNN